MQAAIDAIKPDEVIKVGGSGHKVREIFTSLVNRAIDQIYHICSIFQVLLLMEGKAHAYLFASPGTKRWDTCAPEAILHAMGGQLTDVNGNFYKYDKDTPYSNKGGILATSKKEEHSYYLNAIPQELKDGFK